MGDGRELVARQIQHLDVQFQFKFESVHVEPAELAHEPLAISRENGDSKELSQWRANLF